MANNTYEIITKGSDEYLGFRFIRNDKSDIVLENILLRTPANRIPRWKTELKYSVLLKVNDVQVKKLSEVSDEIRRARSNNNKNIKFTFALHEKTEPVLESLASQLTFDQFVTVKH